MKSYTIECLSEAVSPITHASGTSGNESIIAREIVCNESGTYSIPFLSGNALRHRTIREPGALWLIDRLGLRGQLNLPQLNFLLHGGNLSGSTSHENTRLIADMHRLFPLFRLLGCSLPSQIVAGSLDVWRGTLVCRENSQAIRAYVAAVDELILLPSERFVTGYQYTTGDADSLNIHSRKAELSRIEASGGRERKTSRMIYAGQAVAKGAMFHHGYVLKHVSELNVGAFLLSMRLWQAAGGTIGGSARVGHGRLKTSYLNGFEDRDELVAAYVEHVDANRDDCLAFLMDVFGGGAKDNAGGESASGEKKVKSGRKAGKAARSSLESNSQQSEEVDPLAVAAVELSR